MLALCTEFLAQELWNKSDSLKNKVHGGSQIFAALRVIDGHVRDRRSDVTNDQRSNEQLRARSHPMCQSPSESVMNIKTGGFRAVIR